ncbi:MULTISPECIES: hypothetical protein [unclassified Brenneria]|uniref:hypothetical protein n=1 Tax=unclassified Brenneria TaxID=2634434 RepID=UPI001551D26A|nr:MULTISPECIES: hypothetical protein [unclassified Brenneria]MBJ7220927.1 hypothetical protein [Brenneria sp. L3-3C-1]MEE3642168.1 hypothetical protein [Brenneria sp. L3_3C_1]MEE3650459.1 hypothetical protein [Brenneria sp. HEZEL_4_2_4]NPD00415.1 hypothetical protein [Brenneria sp. hezel4-2-4]
METRRPESVYSSEKICIDYTDYLAALCNKRWRFMDAMYGVLPIFGMVTKAPLARQTAPKDRLKVLALQVLSTQVSDETNIVRLIALARRQGLDAFDIQLPYPLTHEQLSVIGEEFHDSLSLTQRDDRLSVRLDLPAVPH